MWVKNISFLILLVFSLTVFSQSAKKIAKQAKKDYKEKNYQSAIDGYTKALAIKPTNYNYLVGRGTSYEMAGTLKEAIADFKQAIVLKSGAEKLYMQVADLSIRLTDYTTSASYLDNLVALDKKNIEALQKASLSYIMLKQFNTALDRANKALSIQRYNDGNHYYKALALDSLKDYTNAAKDYLAAIRLVENETPNNVKPLAKYKSYYTNYALVLYRLNDFDNAIKNYEQATSMDIADTEEPKQYYVYYLESEPYLKKTDFTNAIGYLNKSMALNPKFAEGFFARAQVYKQTSQFQSAISDFTKALQFDEKNAIALYGRGQSYLELAKYPEAIADLQAANKLQPDNEQIKNLLKEASDKNYQANKEADAPVVTVVYPITDNNSFTNIYDNQLNVLVEGQVIDKSLINEITVNYQRVKFNTSEKNPSFGLKIPAANLKQIDITVKDIYFNTTVKTIKVGRIIDNTRIKVDFAGNVVSEDDARKPYAEKTIYVTNERGEVLYQTKTDAMGHFKFEKLPYDKKYLLMLDVVDASFAGINKYIVTDNNGKTILTSKLIEKGKFKFEIIPSDANTMSLVTVDDKPIKIDVRGKLIADNPERTPLASVKFLLLNERKEVISFHITDIDGNFVFPGLLPSGKYNFAIDVVDSKRIPFNKIYVTDENGKIVKEIVKDAEGLFKFRLIGSEQAQLTTISEEDFDPWKNLKFNDAKKEIEIIENIYYESGSYKILPAAELILVKAIDVLKKNPKLLLEVQSHTDATAGDEYNMELSQKRAAGVVDYMTSKGIDKKRLTAKGFGETQILNRCANGVDCSDEENRQNRRTVFKLSYP